MSQDGTVELQDLAKRLRSFLASTKGKQALRKLKSSKQIYIIAASWSEEREHTICYGIDNSGPVSLIIEQKFTGAEEVRRYVERNRRAFQPVKIIELLESLWEGPESVDEVIDNMISYLTMLTRANAFPSSKIPN